MAKLLTRRAPALGLLALAAADVVLITFALRGGGRPEAADRAAGAAPSSSPSPVAKGPTPSPGHSGQGTASAPRSSPTPGPGNPRLMIEAVDGKHAWRVFAGTCDKGGATIERTSDGGATREHVTSPLRTLSHLQPRSPGAAFVVGADRSCKPQLRSTVDHGESWAPAGRAGAARDGSGAPSPCRCHRPVQATRTSSAGAAPAARVCSWCGPACRRGSCPAPWAKHRPRHQPRCR